MSIDNDRLSRMIARLSAQRACIDFVVAELPERAGSVLEIGLGKGRTYDRLRHLLPDCDIHVFDREVHCPPDVRPPAEKLHLGDFRDTLKIMAETLRNQVMLAHADIGSDDRERDTRLAADISPLIAVLMRPGSWVISDRALTLPGWQPMAQPRSSERWKSFLYTRPAPLGDG